MQADCFAAGRRLHCKGFSCRLLHSFCLRDADPAGNSASCTLAVLPHQQKLSPVNVFPCILCYVQNLRVVMVAMTTTWMMSLMTMLRQSKAWLGCFVRYQRPTYNSSLQQLHRYVHCLHRHNCLILCPCSPVCVWPYLSICIRCGGTFCRGFQ